MLIHWRHPERGTAACNRNIPAWGTVASVLGDPDMRHPFNCIVCKRIHAKWAANELTKLQMGKT